MLRLSTMLSCRCLLSVLSPRRYPAVEPKVAPTVAFCLDAYDGKKYESGGGTAPPKLSFPVMVAPRTRLQFTRMSSTIFGDNVKVAPLVKVRVFRSVVLFVLRAKKSAAPC